MQRGGVMALSTEKGRWREHREQRGSHALTIKKLK